MLFMDQNSNHSKEGKMKQNFDLKEGKSWKKKEEEMKSNKKTNEMQHIRRK